MEFNETWQKATSQCPLPNLCFSGRSEKQDGRPGLWLAETFFDFSSETAERNSTKLDRKQDLNVLYQVCVCRIDRINKMAAVASDWLRHFRLSSETAEWNSTKLGRKQHLNVLYQVYVFLGRSEKQDDRPGLWLAETFLTSPLKPLNGIKRNLIGSKISTSSTKFMFFGPIVKNKMAALASYWLRHFRLLWNSWTEFNETWQKVRYKRPLPSLCFRADRKNKMAAMASDWLRHFSTSPLKPLNGIQRNFTGSKISTTSTKFLFFGPIEKNKMAALALIGWDILNFSSETAERNSTKLDRKQDLNVLYQVCFSGRLEKQDGRPDLWLAETFSTSLEQLNWIQRNLTESKISTTSTNYCIFRADQ